MMITKNINLIKQNFNICLRDYILIWYIPQFINLKRETLRIIKSIANEKKRWVTQFKKKFRLIYSKTLNNLFKKKYKISNTWNYRELFESILNIMNHVKNVNFHNVFNQLIFVYKSINIELKQMLQIFTTFIIVNKFMKQLKKRKFVWWKFYNKYHQQNNFNIKLIQNQFVNRIDDMSNINSYRQIIFNFISSNFQRSNQK